MENNSIKVHPLSSNPTAAWKEFSKEEKIMVFNFEVPTQPVEPNKVRFVCMSDTHSQENNFRFNIPDGDVFIHAGDFTKDGTKEEVVQFNNWLMSLPHQYKILICGNHELSFDYKFSNSCKQPAPQPMQPFGYGYNPYGPAYFQYKYGPGYVCRPPYGPGFVCGPWYGQPPIYSNYGYSNNVPNVENMRQYLTNCIYLEDSWFKVYGIKMYGTPWLPEYRGYYAFNLKRGEECLSKWNLIPSDTDILITHTPPVGYGDLTSTGLRAGCVELLSTVQQRVHPKYHIFGHIHESYGVFSDGKITYINASTCDTNYVPKNVPIVFDVPLPPGQRKNNLLYNID